MAGEGEEDVVERRATQHQIVDLDAGGVEGAHSVDEHGRAARDRRGHLARVVVDRRVTVGDGTQRGSGGGELGPCGHHDLEAVTTDLGLELVAGSVRDHLATVDDDDVLRELVSLFEVLRREEHRGAVGDEVVDDLPHLQAGPRVEAGRGFVEEQDCRRRHEAGREVEPTPHSAGVGLGRTVGGVGEREPLEQLVGPLLHIRRGQVVEASHHVEVLPTGEVFVDGGVLPGQADGPADCIGLGRDVDAGHGRVPGIGAEQRGEDAHRGGLAGAVGSEQTDDGAIGDREIESVDGLDVAEVLDQPFGMDRSVCGGWGHAQEPSV